MMSKFLSLVRELNPAGSSNVKIVSSESKKVATYFQNKTKTGCYNRVKQIVVPLAEH